MLNIGLDIHLRSSALCILDSNGQVVKRESIKGHPRQVADRLRQIDEPFQVCYEASAGYGWLYDQLASLGIPFAEIDAGRSADGVYVLMHDRTVDRTTTGKSPRCLNFTLPDSYTSMISFWLAYDHTVKKTQSLMIENNEPKPSIRSQK